MLLPLLIKSSSTTEPTAAATDSPTTESSIWLGNTEVYGTDHFTDGSSSAGTIFSLSQIDGMIADRVRVELLGNNSAGNKVLSLAEVEVYGNIIQGNIPPVASDATGSIIENAASGTSIATVTATDADTGDTLTYAITAGNSGNQFAINSSTGEITSTTGLDYENATQHILTVTVSDDGSPVRSDTATVTINVTDVPNDDSDGDLLIDEWEATHFGNTTAQDGSGDPDLDLISNEEEETNGTDPNVVNESLANITSQGAAIMGVHDGANLSLLGTSHQNAGNLSHLTDDDPSSRVDTWNDGGSESHSYVGYLWNSPRTDSVRIIRLNMATFLDGGWFGVNNADPGAGNPLVDPTHIGTASLPTLQTTTDGGTTWTTVANTTNYLTYMTGHEIGGGGNVNPTSQVVSFLLNTPVTGINGIRVIGTEGGTASGGFVGFFEIDILAETNQSPSLADTTVAFAENTASGTTVTTLTATDPDSGDTLTYSITAGNDAGLFAINASGQITNTAAPDYETTSQYLLTVEVSDDGSPNLTDTATITINITDIPNDDSQGDGIHDEWAVSNYGTSAVDPQGDTDQDGSNTLLEFWGGGDPNNPGSLGLQTTAVGASTDPASPGEYFEWKIRNDAALGTDYKVYGAAGLNSFPELILDTDYFMESTTPNGSEHSTVRIRVPSASTYYFIRLGIQ